MFDDGIWCFTIKLSFSVLLTLNAVEFVQLPGEIPADTSFKDQESLVSGSKATVTLDKAALPEKLQNLKTFLNDSSLSSLIATENWTKTFSHRNEA